MSSKLFLSTIETPIGNMAAVSSEKGICLLEFDTRPELNAEIEAIEIANKSKVTKRENVHLTLLKTELEAYFVGKLQNFSLDLDIYGTDFQQSVWNALLKIPYGETRTYKQQSLTLGDLKAIRAVASANGKNKLAILIPCHRVIGSDGSLTGYAGGLDRKRFLLNLEREIAGPKDLFNS
jgi:O-6-methylguanine DNA methyltransferase